MKSNMPNGFAVDYVEIYTPMAKALAYWHIHALGFTLIAKRSFDTDGTDVASYVLESHGVRLVLTSTYPTFRGAGDNEVSLFLMQNYCGIKRIAVKVDSVKEAFEESIANGAIPLKFPAISEDGAGKIEEASIRLYDHNEIAFVDRSDYSGAFKPGYMVAGSSDKIGGLFFTAVDHIAAEVRINEAEYWSKYLANAIGTNLVQRIQKSEDNKTGMLLNVNQSSDSALTFVIAEPDTYTGRSKVQQNIDAFGPGIHHLAFRTNDMIDTVKKLTERDVEFVSFPSSYYDLLRKDDGFRDMDIDMLQRWGVIADKENDTFLLQKFIKPISDRPFFLYEIVERVNGYQGFALKNINVLKKAEEMNVITSNNIE